MMVLNGMRTEWGNFCDPACANTYMHTNMNDSNLAARVADFYEYVQDVHGWEGENIGFAPHFSMLERYGGCLSDEKYMKVARTPGLRTFQRMAPFIPTEVVIEWQRRIDEMEADEAKPAAAQPTCAFGSDRRAEEKKKTASAYEALAKIIGYKPEAAHHHHQWEVRGLRQPPMAEIEARLMSLPKPEEKEGLYRLYWERHGKGAPLPQESMEDVPAAAQGPVPSRAKKSKTAASSQSSNLGSMLVPTKKPSL